MKNIIIFILIAFVSIGRVSGQIKDLIDMAEEPVLAFLPIEDGDDNYGYMVLYELDEKQKEIFNYRYVILDNYLNNVANGEFELANYYGVNAPFSSVKKIDGKLLLEREHYRSDDPYTRQWYYIELDIERNTLGAPFYVENNTIKTGNLPWKAYKKAGKNHKMFASLKPLESGYIGFYRYKNSKDGRGIQKLTLFGSDRSVQWAADISANKNNVFNHYLEYIDEDIIILREWSKNEMNFTGYNTATGDVVFHFNYENKNSTYSHSYGIKVERVNDNLHFVGKICEYRKSGYKLDQSVGLFRKVFDIKGNAISDDLILWTDLAEDAIIDHDGEVQDGYPLRIQQFYVFNDERVTAVAERVRKKSMGIRALSDFYIVELSADFKLKHIEKIEKLEKTVLYRQGTNDFLFSQKTADGNGCVILYETYEEETVNEESQSIVGIVKMIDGKISQDVLRKNSEDYYLTAHPAARGYVLLREFDFEEKVNTIRLEKINF